MTTALDGVIMNNDGTVDRISEALEEVNTRLRIDEDDTCRVLGATYYRMMNTVHRYIDM